MFLLEPLEHGALCSSATPQGPCSKGLRPRALCHLLSTVHRPPARPQVLSVALGPRSGPSPPSSPRSPVHARRAYRHEPEVLCRYRLRPGGEHDPGVHVAPFSVAPRGAGREDRGEERGRRGRNTRPERDEEGNWEVSTKGRLHETQPRENRKGGVSWTSLGRHSPFPVTHGGRSLRFHVRSLPTPRPPRRPGPTDEGGVPRTRLSCGVLFVYSSTPLVPSGSRCTDDSTPPVPPVPVGQVRDVSPRPLHPETPRDPGSRASSVSDPVLVSVRLLPYPGSLSQSHPTPGYGLQSPVVVV